MDRSLDRIGAPVVIGIGLKSAIMNPWAHISNNTIRLN